MLFLLRVQNIHLNAVVMTLVHYIILALWGVIACQLGLIIFANAKKVIQSNKNCLNMNSIYY